MNLRMILTATDFSPSAGAAVRRAATLAKAGGAALQVAHALYLNPLTEAWTALSGADGISVDSLRATAARRLDELAADIHRRFGIPVAAQVLDGKPAAAIAARAREVAADLVVIGAHGENLLLDLFVGSTAAKLLRLPGGPVLMVREAPTVDYERIVIATDFSPAAATAANLASRWWPDAALDLFHAYEAPFERQIAFAGGDDEVLDHYRRLGEAEARRQMEAFAGALDAPDRFARRLRHGYAPALINQHVAATGAELLVVGSHRQSDLEATLLGSVAAHLVAESRVDLLLVPGPATAAD